MDEPTFFVRDIPVYGDVILAPMAGYADVPHRAICRAWGSCMQYTEFVAAEDILGKGKKPLRLLKFTPDERPRIMQIFSHDVDRLLRAAVKIMNLDPAPEIIDINMGCSTRRVSGRGAGVGMMKNPALIAETFEVITRELPIPITGKIRLGWDGAENYLEIGRIMQESGASLVAIHPRTKEQKYSGEARWEAIAELKQALTIPVIGNGDIKEPDDIDKMLAYTGCDAVMIGRGAIGNPWLFGRKSRADISTDDLFFTIRHHAQAMVEQHGEKFGLPMFRKFLKRYLNDMPLQSGALKALLQVDELADFLEQLLEIESIYSFAPLPETAVRLHSSQTTVQR